MEPKIPLLLMLGFTSQDSENDAEPAARVFGGTSWLESENGPPDSRRIIVATDLASGSERAWRVALKLAARTGATLDLVHVTDAYLRMFKADDRPLNECVDELIESIRTVMSSYVKQALALGIPCGLRILVGVPAFEIERYARAHEAALVILSLSGDFRGRVSSSWSLGVLEQILGSSLWRLVVLRTYRQDEPEQYN